MIPTKEQVVEQIKTMQRYMTPQSIVKIDWKATADYWADSREQQKDAYGRTPFDNRACVYFPR